MKILIKILDGQAMYNWLYAHDEKIKNVNGDKVDGINTAYVKVKKGMFKKFKWKISPKITSEIK